MFGLAAAAAIWSLFGSDSARDIEQLLQQATRGASEGSIRREQLEELVAPTMVLKVEERTRTLSLSELEGVLAEYVLEHGRRLHDLQGLEVTVDGSHAAANGILVISESQAGDLHAEERPFEAHLERTSGWRIHRLEVGAARKHIPEARP